MKPEIVEFKSEENLLYITWDDEQIQHFPVSILRGFCPCAGCQGHGGGLPKFLSHQEKGLKIENITPVGNYGMCVIWGDGHDTGIYSFQTLRRYNLNHYLTHMPEVGEVLNLHN